MSLDAMAKRKISSVPLPGIEPQFPAWSLVTVLNEVRRYIGLKVNSIA
jgi:hypothetical protein